METPGERVPANLREVRERLAAAAARSGRSPEAVRLVAVTKTVGEDLIRVLVGAGQRDLGENRAQQLRDRARNLADLDIAWHMIGRLQRKNAKYVAPVAAMIHSVDSVELAEELSKRVAVPAAAIDSGNGKVHCDRSCHSERSEESRRGQAEKRDSLRPCSGQASSGLKPLLRRTSINVTFTGINKQSARVSVPCLLEINSGEEQKAGVAPAKADAVASAIARLPGIDLAGLMTLAPLRDDPETVRPVFAALRELRDRLNRHATLPRPLTELSMGMSQDYEVAAEEGATIVRVGTALFR
jgi:PLP dependent protein